jgi:hypothetical protein
MSDSPTDYWHNRAMQAEAELEQRKAAYRISLDELRKAGIEWKNHAEKAQAELAEFLRLRGEQCASHRLVDEKVSWGNYWMKNALDYQSRLKRATEENDSLRAEILRLRRELMEQEKWYRSEMERITNANQPG